MKKVFCSLSILLTWGIAYTQVQQTWAYSHIAQLHDQYVDANGNIYQTGLAYSEAFDDEGYLTIKHDKSGNEIWRHFSPGREKRSHIAVDPLGNVYVAGSTGNPNIATVSNDTHFYIMKLNSNGVFQWSNTYWEFEGSSPYAVYGRPNGLAIDPNGNPYITGVVFTAFTDAETYSEHPDSATGDFITIKYDAATGNRVWVRTYNGANPGEGYDDAKGIAIDPFGYIYVSGTSQLNGFMDIATIKYDPAGNEVWVRRYSNSDPGFKNDYANPDGLKLDAAGNVIVSGSCKAGANIQGADGEGKRVIIKYTFSGFELWVRERAILFFSNGPIIIDHTNSIIESSDGYTKKYNAAGDLLWTISHSATALAVDGDNDLYTVSFCLRADNNLCGEYYGFTTRKFRGSTGTMVWEKTYAFFSNGGEFIGVDADKNVYTSGSGVWSGTRSTSYHTVRYSQCEIICPNNITVNVAPGTCSAVVNYPAATTSGACGSEITYSHASGSTFHGTTTVTVTSTETGATCSFTITVVDNENPVITSCPSSKTLNTDAGVCYASANSVNVGQATATDNCSGVSVQGVRSDGLALTDNYPVGITTITWTATDASNNTATCTQTITVEDKQKPEITNVSVSKSVLAPPNHKMIDVELDYEVTDNCSYTVAVTVTSDEPATGLSNGDQGPDIEKIDDKHWRLRAERDGKGDGRVYTITITATDGSNNVSTETRTVVVAHNISAPHSGASVKVGSTVNFTGTFWDVPGNKHTAQWIIDEKTIVKGIVTEPSGMKNGSVAGSYKFTSPGVYKLKMNITDQRGIITSTTTNDDLEAIIVVYDPNGGYTYGGGYFASPSGALKTDPMASGDVSYGFTVNYYKTASLPKGETQFEFHLGNFEYNAVNFEYLAISGAKAQFKGTGKIIGGQSGINFIMTVMDGQLDGSGVDKVRMKIYNRNTGQVYYDNQPGASDAANPVASIGENSTIVIYNSVSNSVTSRATDEQTTLAATSFEVISYPNPGRAHFNLLVKSDDISVVALQVVDVLGRIVESRKISANQTVSFGQSYKPGAYFVKLVQGRQQKEIKLIKLE